MGEKHGTQSTQVDPQLSVLAVQPVSLQDGFSMKFKPPFAGSGAVASNEQFCAPSMVRSRGFAYCK